MNLSKQEVADQFLKTIKECRNLYVSSGLMMVKQYEHLIPEERSDFVAYMDDLHKGLLIKLFVSVCDADFEFSREESLLANVLIQHTWGHQVRHETFASTWNRVREDSVAIRWYSVIRPFDELEPLREHIAELETLIFRFANLVAKSDGNASESELEVIRKIQSRVTGLFHGVSGQRSDAQTKSPSQVAAVSQSAVSTAVDDRKAVRKQCHLEDDDRPLDMPKDSPQEEIDHALAELEQLVGMDKVKEEVKSLVNFLELQRRRKQAGLPDTTISLHLVFKGNPGTGKTTIARLLGQVYGGLSILKKGHLVETDRSGLVAEYAGQTGPKANAKIDEALDGILFIDEAYSLISDRGDDPFGAEAIQTLLKRMEDDRDRLVVILAGYPNEIDRLLRSNPGLGSRFNHVFQFPDYTPQELGKIFGLLCDKNHYTTGAEVQGRLLVALQWLYENRDEHFGNGRLVRNVFEQAIRRLANRVAHEASFTPDMLTNFSPCDFQFDRVPTGLLSEDRVSSHRFAMECVDCGRRIRFSGSRLGQKAKCPECSTPIATDWAAPDQSGG